MSEHGRDDEVRSWLNLDVLDTEVWEGRGREVDAGMTVLRPSGVSYVVCYLDRPGDPSPWVFSLALEGHRRLEDVLPDIDRVVDAMSHQGPIHWRSLDSKAERRTATARAFGALRAACEPTQWFGRSSLVTFENRAAVDVLVHSAQGLSVGGGATFERWYRDAIADVLEHVRRDVSPPLEPPADTSPPVPTAVADAIAALTPLLAARLTAAAESGVDLEQLGSPDDLAAAMVEALPVADPAEVARRAGPFFTVPDTAAYLGLPLEGVELAVRRGDLLGARSREGDLHIPAWQFDPAGQSLPALTDIARPLREHLSDWGVLTWLTQSRRWLDGASPVRWISSGGDAEIVRLHASDDAEAWSR